MRTSHFASAIAFLLAAGCASQPSWADGAVVRQPGPSPTTGQNLADLPRRMLALHNHERAAVGVPPLNWDPQLAAAAAAYGSALAARGGLVHSQPAARVGQGENLWMGTRGAYSPEQMVASWSGEKALFRAGVFPDISRNGNWAEVGHYTQMVWRDTTSVGCAIHSSPQWDFLICRYAPMGNMMGDRVP